MGIGQMISDITSLVKRGVITGSYEFVDETDGEMVTISDFEVYEGDVYFGFTAFPSGEEEHCINLLHITPDFLRQIYRVVFRKTLDCNLF